ncbi:MAG: signal peptidase II [Bacillota bacterium]
MNRKTLSIVLFIVGGIVALDQLTKLWIVSALNYSSSPGESESLTVIEGFLEITSHRNYGASWGMFQDQLIFFIIVTTVALGVFIFLSKDIAFKEKPLYSIGLTMLIGGTIGNFIDRLRLGYVIDFIDTMIFTYDFPIFNVADMALTVGMTLFAIDIVILDEIRKKKGRENDEQ